MEELALDKDYKYLLKDSWRLNAYGYAIREHGSKRRGTCKVIFLHREVAGAKKGEIVDHINGNKLDNRRENLRICTHTQNLWNRGKQRNNNSGYKGVTFHRQSGKWFSRITANKKTHYLGIFESPQEAHSAYKNAAKLLHKDFAHV